MSYTYRMKTVFKNEDTVFFRMVTEQRPKFQNVNNTTIQLIITVIVKYITLV